MRGCCIAALHTPVYWTFVLTMTRRLLSLTLLGLIPALTGCVSRTHIVRRTRRIDVVLDSSVEQLVKRTNAQFEAIQTLNASVEIAASTGGTRTGEIKEYTALAGYIFIRKPADLRVLLLLPVLRSKAIDMVSDGKTFKLLIAPPRNKAIVGTNTVTEPSKNGLENLRPPVFLDSLLVRGTEPNQIVSLTQSTRIIPPAPLVNGKGSTDMLEEPDYDLQILALPEGEIAHTERVIHISRANLLPVQQDVYNASGQIITRAFYSNYGRFGTIDFPQKIRIERPLDEYSLTVTVLKVTFNEKLEDDQFELKIPEGVPIQQMK